ncbi:MAG: alpha/beta hydrolase [Acidimicrobiia bacterium]|nr:alpha/beta hydrolase [Acidimicrobiia bacterium]
MLQVGPLGRPGGGLRPAHRIVRWDRRGMGRSTADGPADSPARHADDLAAILDAEGIDRVVVAGHAGGGPTALTFAVRHADRAAGLIMVDTRVTAAAPDGGPSPWAAGLDKSCARLERDGAPYFERLYRGFFGPRAPEAVVADAVANALATPVATATSEMRHMALDMAPTAAQVRCPVLWVSAQPDDTAEVRERFPATDVTIGHVVGSGHFVQVEVPDQLNPMIAAFLVDKVGG